MADPGEPISPNLAGRVAAVFTLAAQRAAGWAGDYLDSDAKDTLDAADVSALAHVDLATVLDGTRTNGIGTEELYEDLRRRLDDGVDRAGHDPFGAGAVYDDFDGKGARYVDDVGAWQAVEPALDFTTTALPAFALTAQGEGQ